MKTESEEKLVAKNPTAYHNYSIDSTLEAGIVLTGTEIKSVRNNKVNIKDSYVIIKNGEAFVVGMHISPYEFGNIYNKDPLRTRKLLLKKREINKLFGKGNLKWQSSDFERDSEVFKALFGITNDGYNSSKKTLLEDLITNDEYLIDPNQPVTVQNMKMDEIIQIGKEKYSPRQLQGYVFIAKKLFDEYADALGDMVQSAKIDTKNHGINYMEQKRYKDRYNELKKYDENLFDNLKPMLEESFIDYKTNNAIDLLKDILGEQMIHFTDQFFSI